VKRRTIPPRKRRREYQARCLSSEKDWITFAEQSRKVKSPFYFP
jgi:hypothetical protein